MSSQKGLIVNVYRCSLGDCTNGGVSSTHDRVLLVGEDIPPVSESREDIPVVNLVRRTVFGRERIQVENGMFGGNFVYTSDSRFPSQYPIPVHDRTE